MNKTVYEREGMLVTVSFSTNQSKGGEMKRQDDGHNESPCSNFNQFDQRFFCGEINISDIFSTPILPQAVGYIFSGSC